MLLKKCVAFTGDNCNIMFGELRRNEQGNNVLAKLKKMLSSSLIGINCLAHVLNNCIHHGAERMNIDIENNINEFANCEYMRLLSHSKANKFISDTTANATK